MRLFFSSLVVAAAAVTFSVAAHADTVTFASSPSATTTGTTLAGSYSGPAAVQVTSPASAYPTAQPGSVYVSTNAAGNQALGTTYYTNSFSLLSGESYAGTVTFSADDYADIFVNGNSVYTHTNNAQYSFTTTVGLLPSYFTSGLNTITFALTNTGGPGAIDFGGSVNGTAVTPEPSSLMLLGTGILGVAGAARRRFLTA